MGRDLAKMQSEVAAAWKKAGKPPTARISRRSVRCPITVPGAVDALVRAARQVRQAADGRRPGARHRLRATTDFPVTQLVALYWKANMAAFEKNKALIEELDNARATYLVNGHTPARRRSLPQSRSGAHTDRCSRKAAATPSTRARSRTRSTRISSASAATCATRISPAHHGEWVDAAVGQLPRL